MSDIQKEREEFEAWVIENLADGRSMSWEGWCWKSWQAAKAKAQAVPEGFILMPKVPTERMVNATRGKHEGAPYLPYSIYEAFVEQATIEAQEQKG